MPFAYIMEIPADGHGHTVPVPPPEKSGGIPFGVVFFSLAADSAGYENITEMPRCRVAVKTPGGWIITDQTPPIYGRPWAIQLPAGTECVNVLNPGPPTVTAMVEVGKAS